MDVGSCKEEEERMEVEGLWRNVDDGESCNVIGGKWMAVGRGEVRGRRGKVDKKRCWVDGRWMINRVEEDVSMI